MKIRKEELGVGHILKVDFFGQPIKVSDNRNENGVDLIDGPLHFFEKIYEPTRKNLVINNEDIGYKAEQWVEQDDFLYPQQSILYLVEGYAGCGKTTLVQKMLYQIFKHENYDYGYYNYDIGGINSYSSNKNKNSNSQTISNDIDEDDQVTATIRFALRNQICNTIAAPIGERVFNVFKGLTSDDVTLNNLMSDNLKIALYFAHVEHIEMAVRDFREGQIQRDELNIKIEVQLRRFGRYDMFCMDYLWRLAQCIAQPEDYRKYCYVCYDNLDSIENYSVLNSFHKDLMRFRYNLNVYIEALRDKFERENNPQTLHHFVIFATYRRITAVRTGVHNYEAVDDFANGRAVIKHIDLSHQYDFNKIANKRINHFINRFKNDASYTRCNPNLLPNLKLVPHIIGLDFVKRRYVGLWNNNFRSCSNVINNIFRKDPRELKACIDIVKRQDGRGEYSYYFGASSVFLNLVCKVLSRCDVFSPEHMGFVDLRKEKPARTYSISRLILTYLHNCDGQEASITELYDKFGKVSGVDELCEAITGMLTRVEGEIWRRPIYYTRNAPSNEESIKTELEEQCEAYKQNKTREYIGFCVGDCGITLIDEVIPNFEFYSVRIRNDNQPLYLIGDTDTLEKIIKEVYIKIAKCCDYQKEFMDKYMSEYKISKEQYLAESFHPRTRSGNVQLHIERIIFSHISYLNKCRQYYIDVYNSDTQVRDKINDIFLEYIGNYLDLYNDKVMVMSTARKRVYDSLSAKLTNAKNGRGDARYAPIEIDDESAKS